MKKKTRRKYTDEFKDESVKLVAEQGYKVSEAARNLWSTIVSSEDGSKADHPRQTTSRYS